MCDDARGLVVLLGFFWCVCVCFVCLLLFLAGSCSQRQLYSTVLFVHVLPKKKLREGTLSKRRRGDVAIGFCEDRDVTSSKSFNRNAVWITEEIFMRMKNLFALKASEYLNSFFAKVHSLWGVLVPVETSAGQKLILKC